MTAALASYDTGHTDVVHDVQFDYYGRRIATCSSDRTVKVHEITGNEQTQYLSELSGHEGPVWQVTWAHPKFGSLIASCSFDNKVIIWKEVSPNSWAQVFSTPLHTASVNGVAFAPHELGLLAAAASSDGSLSILTYTPDTQAWATSKVEKAHAHGAMAVSWAPAAPPGSLVSTPRGPITPEKRIASCGCDGAIKIWRYAEAQGQWLQEGSALQAHVDWVRDVAWAPNLGLPLSTLASAGQDGRVYVWAEDSRQGTWAPTLLHQFQGPVWRVSWSLTGSVLAVSDSQQSVTLWKESTEGKWQQLSS